MHSSNHLNNTSKKAKKYLHLQFYNFQKNYILHFCTNATEEFHENIFHNRNLINIMTQLSIKKNLNYTPCTFLVNIHSNNDV